MKIAKRRSFSKYTLLRDSPEVAAVSAPIGEATGKRGGGGVLAQVSFVWFIQNWGEHFVRGRG